MNAINFVRLAAPITNRRGNYDSNVALRQFKNMFGVSPFACAWVWMRLQFDFLVPVQAQPIHFLWTLLFLSQYMTN